MEENATIVVDEIMAQIRARVRARRQFVGDPTPRAASPELYELAELRAAVAEIEVVWKQFGAINPRPPGALNNLAQLIKKAIRRSLTWYTRPQREFNGAVARSFSETERALENAQASLSSITDSLVEHDRLILARLDALTIQLNSLESIQKNGTIRAEHAALAAVEERLNQIERLLCTVESQLVKHPVGEPKNSLTSVRPSVHGE